MAEKILMLALSPTMESGTIAKWNNKEGDTISNGDVICEVETDKATMDYESFSEGTLLKIVVAEGGQARVGDTIGIVGEKGEDITALLASTPKKETKPAIVKDEKSKTIESPVPVSDPASVPQATAVAGSRASASPLARRMAEENGLSIARIPGSGPGGRVVKRDIEAALSSGGSARPGAAPVAAALTDEVIPRFAKTGHYCRAPGGVQIQRTTTLLSQTEHPHG